MRLWLQWYETLFSEPEVVNPSWLPDRMEYAFSVGARFSDGECVLTAQEYFAGHLDWYAFDANAAVTLGATTDEAFTDITHTVIPAVVCVSACLCAREQADEPSVESVFPAPVAAQKFGEPTY